MSTDSEPLTKAAAFMITELLRCPAGSQLVITADTGSDVEVVEALLRAASTQNVSPTVVWMPTLESVNLEPPPPVAAAMLEADRICSLEKVYFIHSEATQNALRRGARVVFLGGMDSDSITRCIGEINFREMIELGDGLTELIKAGRKMTITTPAGTDLVAEIDPGRPVYHHRGIADKKNDITFLGGQIAFAPIEESIRGTMVFDGALWPPNELGLLASPIELTVERGTVVRVAGGEEAERFEAWLRGFDDPSSYNVAHLSLGFNPGAKLTGNIIEDERVFGCIEVGIGTQSDHFRGRAGRAPCHTDGVILSPSFWIDDVVVEENGSYVCPEVANLAAAALGNGGRLE